MKASEYYEKYGRLLTAEDVDTTGFAQLSQEDQKLVADVIDHQVNRGIREALFEMSMEVKSLISSRKARTNSAAAAVIREVNDRWNAMLRLIEKDGKPVLVKRDAVARYWLSEIPELSKYIRVPKEDDEQ